MKKISLSIGLILFLFGCTTNMPAPVTSTPQEIQTVPTERSPAWAVYDTDPNHIWNRVFRQFFERTSASGEDYGTDELDPLLWFDTTYLLFGESHQRAIRVLDEFLDTHAETLIQAPLKRAMFQRDMWAVFDWLASQTEPHTSQRLALQSRLAQVIRQVALSKAEIMYLPDNYALELDANTFPSNVLPDHPEMPFLPADLFQPESAWVPVGREGGPVAITHTESFPFYGRSVFFVFYRSPDGRSATLDFINALNTDPSNALTMGLDVALVRRMLLIDDQGHLILSPLVETVQLRHFSPKQTFHEFELSRSGLFHELAGGLELNTDLFLLFMSHGDVFEIPDWPVLKVTVPEICKGCHFENPPLPNPGNTQSIISHSRQPFPLSDSGRPILFATTLMDEAETVIQWKSQHPTWTSLQELWNAHP